ncbi:hypothetical protein ID866_8989, partial [Astraeus odoratus]
MRLTFSTDDYLNAVLTDDYGRDLYTVSTSGFTYAETTITKHGFGGTTNVIAIIRWNSQSTTIWFWGKEYSAGTLLTKQSPWSRQFTGPDGRLYAWHLKETKCVLKLTGTGSWFAKYHKRDSGTRLKSHAPYLEIGSYVEYMWDHIV